MQSCIFIIITPVFSVTWSSEIIIIYWFAAHETFLIIINVDNSRAALYFCGNSDALIFRILWWIKSSKEQHLLDIDICYDIINILLSFVTNLMHPCWIKVFMSFKKKSYWPQTFERGCMFHALHFKSSCVCKRPTFPPCLTLFLASNHIVIQMQKKVLRKWWENLHELCSTVLENIVHSKTENKMKMSSPSGRPRCRRVCSSSDFEKCCIISLAQQWMLCSEWVPSEWVQTADKNITKNHQ